MDLKQNMKLVKHLMKTPVFFIDRFQQIYSFSNENLTGVFQNFDVKGKDCLCVQASSDQVMDLFVMGAKSVDTFDINPLTEPYFYLKKAAICAGLNPQDLLYFFNCYNFKETYQHILNSNTFRFLARYLEGDMLRFWEYVFTNYSTFQMKSHLFSFEQVHPKVLLHSLNYLDEENVKWLQKNISNFSIQFHHSNFTSLIKLLQRQYDFIYLSNIIQYAENLFPTNYDLCTQDDEIRKLEMFKKSVEEFIPYLTKNGEIMVGYLYLMLGCSIDEPIFRKELRDQVFSTNYHYVSFTSISELEKKFKNNLVIPYSKDVCMVLKKD